MDKKTNVIIIMTDQQRADVCKREGFPLDTTPFMDSLASKGKWFDHAYTTSPLCVPARISLLTGRYPSAHHVRINPTAEHAFYDKDMFDVFKHEGYATAMIGKNHSHIKEGKPDYWFELGHNGGKGESRSDTEKAFDNWLGKELSSRVGMEPSPFPIQVQGPCRAVNEAQNWISSLKDMPFFLWLSFPEPHNPYQVPEPYFSMFPVEELPQPKEDKSILKAKGYKWQWLRDLGEYAHPDYDMLIPRARANYFGMMRLIDDQIKVLIEYLENEGILDNTLIVFMSDHGDFVGEYGLMRKGPELPEILTRVPMFFVGPGLKAENEASHAFVSIADVFPTLCEAVDIPIPAGVQGRSLWPLLTGGEYPKHEFDSIYSELGYGGHHFDDEYNINFDETLNKFNTGKSFDELNGCTQSGFMRMVRKGNWKLIYDMMGRGQLYDLEKDPMEINNLYDSPQLSEVRIMLLEEMVKWILRTEDTLPQTKAPKYRLRTKKHNYWTE